MSARLNSSFARAGFIVAAILISARPVAAADSEQDAPAVDALLQTIQQLQSNPEALAKAIEALKKQAADARAALDAAKPKAEQSAAKLKELADKSEAIKAESKKLSERLDAIKAELSALDKDLPEVGKQAEAQKKESEAAQARLALLERLGQALNTIAGAPPQPPAAPPAKTADPTVKPPAPPAAPAKAAGAKVDPQAAEFFETKIRPVLAQNCFECHGPEKQKSGLRLDSLAAMLKGGENGPVLVPGKPDETKIIKAIHYDGDPKMPPKGKLPQEAIDALTQWVKMGAPWPEPKTSADTAPAPTTEEEKIADARAKHWSFQQVKKPALPPVKNSTWAAAPIDQFILSKLEEKALKPSTPTDKRTLLRRATLDLTGLPPTYDEVKAFESDSSPDAFARVVDRLLASPRYGERWGRYWLDVARYADTKGYNFASGRDFPYSYTYRDYVIRAFNEDLPYDRFIIEQLAADKLDLKNDKRPLAAMGFLTLGRRFLGNIDDIVDDRIDVTARGLMALTVSCARCHDHKFDPIPSADYYSLYGVFRSSVEPEEPPLLAEPEKTPAYLDYVKELAAREADVANFLETSHIEKLTEFREKASQYMLAAHDSRDIKEDAPFRALAGERKLHPEIVRRWQDYLKEKAKAHDPIFAPWFGFAALKAEEFATKGKELAASYTANGDPQKKLNPLISKAFAGDPPTTMAQVAERYQKVYAEADKRWADVLLAHSQIQSQKKDGEKAAPPSALLDENAEAIRRVLYAPEAPGNATRELVDSIRDVPTRDKLQNLRNAVLRVKSTHPGRPDRGMVLVDADKPFDPYVFKRGNPGNKGDSVPRRFLAVLAGDHREPFKEGSGRLELAKDIASKDNPLTARVMVNRVWNHHFGAPLVATPSDFGSRSTPPVERELLDYLAWSFMENGWSLKKLHREIMLSNAYRQSSGDDEAARKADPENRLLWRFNRQRLDFEAMRDSLLVASGKIDFKMGGPSVEIAEGEPSLRRTVYGFVERQNLPGLFRTFDFATPDASSPARYYTTVPQQALYLMNSPFVINQAKSLARRKEIADQTAPEAKIESLYRYIFDRDAKPAEIKLAENFIAGQDKTEPDPEPNPPAWKYGYGKYDAEKKKLESFDAFPYYSDKGFWQGGEKFPDPKLGSLRLSADGGHPGKASQGSAIRRWVAPRDGVVTISGTIKHVTDKGDGLLAYIYSSGLGELGRLTVRHGEAEVSIPRIQVIKGETIDFIAACNADDEGDTFVWNPVVKFTEERAAASQVRDDKKTWEAKLDFTGPPPPKQEPLSAWEEYAQVLLLSNEFMFVD